ncbi:MAG: hypothetical protein WCO71_08645 [Pseudomonadota bacterium]
MLHIPLTQMKIGRRPDYAMRLGKMDVYHKANIYVFSRERKFKTSIVKSDRSLQTVAIGIRDVLKNTPFIGVIRTGPLPSARRRFLETRTGFIMIRLRLPVTLDKNKFHEICKHFWEVIFPEEQKTK